VYMNLTPIAWGSFLVAVDPHTSYDWAHVGLSAI
jgi:hypothetical protein